MARRMTGVVRWFDGSKGYGYIDSEKGENVFVHHSALAGFHGQFLRPGERVEFFLETTVQGPQATDVVRPN